MHHNRMKQTNRRKGFLENALETVTDAELHTLILSGNS